MQTIENPLKRKHMAIGMVIGFLIFLAGLLPVFGVYIFDISVLFMLMSVGGAIIIMVPIIGQIIPDRVGIDDERMMLLWGKDIAHKSKEILFSEVVLILGHNNPRMTAVQVILKGNKKITLDASVEKSIKQVLVSKLMDKRPDLFKK